MRAEGARWSSVYWVVVSGAPARAADGSFAPAGAKNDIKDARCPRAALVLSESNSLCPRLHAWAPSGQGPTTVGVERATHVRSGMLDRIQERGVSSGSGMSDRIRERPVSIGLGMPEASRYASVATGLDS